MAEPFQQSDDHGAAFSALPAALTLKSEGSMEQLGHVKGGGSRTKAGSRRGSPQPPPPASFDTATTTTTRANKRPARGRTQERELSALSPSASLVGWKMEDGNSSAGGPSKRARRPPTRFVEDDSVDDYQDQLRLHQALQNSKIETRLLDSPDEIPDVKTY